MLISLIVAIGKNRELGRDNKLLFQIPEDMKFFRDKTRGHAVVMGRKTYESIGHPLPNRVNIVVSRDSRFLIPDSNVKVVHSIEEAIELGKQEENRLRKSRGESKELFVIGGAQIYKLAMPFADKLYLTLVNAKVKVADAFFPDYKEFKNIVSQRKSKDKNYEYEFLEIER